MAKADGKGSYRGVGGTQDGDIVAGANDSSGKGASSAEGGSAESFNRGLTGNVRQGGAIFAGGASSLGDMQQGSFFDEAPAAATAGASFVPGDRCRSLHGQFEGELPVYAFDGRNVWLPVPMAEFVQPYPALAVERVAAAEPLPEVAVGQVVVHWADPLTYWVVCELTSTYAMTWNCSTWKTFPRAELAPPALRTEGLSSAYAKRWVRRLLLSMGKQGLLDAIRSNGVVL